MPHAALAAVVVTFTLAGCDSHDGIWGPSGGKLTGDVLIRGTSNAAGVIVTVNDRNYANTTVTTPMNGTYSFWCGDDDVCRITAHADSTLERDLVKDVRGGRGVVPDTFVFTGLGAISGPARR